MNDRVVVARGDEGIGGLSIAEVEDVQRDGRAGQLLDPGSTVGLALTRLSTISTSWPAPASRTAVWEPM